MDIEVKYLNTIKAISGKPSGNIILNDEKLKPFLSDKEHNKYAHFATISEHNSESSSQSN